MLSSGRSCEVDRGRETEGEGEVQREEEGGRRKMRLPDVWAGVIET